jgi:hypothetical protein
MAKKGCFSLLGFDSLRATIQTGIGEAIRDLLRNDDTSFGELNA